MLQRRGMPGLQTREVNTPLFACHSSCFSAWRDCTHIHAGCASVTPPALLHPRLTISADTQQQSKTVTVSAGQIRYFCSSSRSTPSPPLSALCSSLHLVLQLGEAPLQPILRCQLARQVVLFELLLGTNGALHHLCTHPPQPLHVLPQLQLHSAMKSRFAMHNVCFFIGLRWAFRPNQHRHTPGGLRSACCAGLTCRTTFRGQSCTCCGVAIGIP